MTQVTQAVELRGELRLDEPMARHTSWRVGGPARRFYRPADTEDLAVFLSQLDPEEPLLWLGLGSNLLVRDGGFAGTVIATQGRLTGLTQVKPNGIRAEAGVACAQLARFTARLGLSGLEFFAGIPGTVGGALAMNAGAFGSETWSWVEQVETIDRRGVIRFRRPDEFSVGYRRVDAMEGEWFLAAGFRLERGDAEASLSQIKTLLDRRGTSQPIGLPSCGSVFRNPPGDYAGRLIETVGLKGHRIGNAEVSPKHANFILNLGEASAADIESLIRLIQEKVEQASGIRLHTEVKILGEQV